MRMPGKMLTAVFLASAFLFPSFANAQAVNFKEIEAKVREFRGVLDQAGINGTRFWTRLDSSKRPHRLYVGDGFMTADEDAKESTGQTKHQGVSVHMRSNPIISPQQARKGPAGPAPRDIRERRCPGPTRALD